MFDMHNEDFIEYVLNRLNVPADVKQELIVLHNAAMFNLAEELYTESLCNEIKLSEQNKKK